MSCYHPNMIAFNVEPETGETYMQFIPGQGLEADGVHSIAVPCGKCIGCRLDHSKEWADRMMIELDHMKTGIFVTLTYNDDNLPLSEDGVPIVNKRHCQLFMKRLREYFEGKKIRFYLASEYGPKTHRPHYHAILFGLSLSDFPDLVHIGKNEFGQPYYGSDRFTRLWSYGFTSLSEVSWRTCNYVARYCTKKVFNEVSDALPEFSLSSRRPGIGGYFYDDHPNYDSLNYFVPDPNDINAGAKRVNVSKYHLRKLSELNPDLAFEIKQRRLQAFQDNQIDLLTKTDKDIYSYMKQAEVNALEKHRKFLKRKEL